MTRMSSTNFQLLLRSWYVPITAISVVGPHKRRKCVRSLRRCSWTKRAGQPVSMPRSQSRALERQTSYANAFFSSFFSLAAHTQCWSKMLGVLDAEKEEGGVRFSETQVVCLRKRSLLKLPPLRFVHVRALIGKTRFSLRLSLLRGFVCV